MRLNELKAPVGSHHRKKRVGRGEGSGHGKTCTRGQKGQRARSGEGKRPGFEGGQTPLIKRLPKRGFTNPFKKVFEIVNLSRLDIFQENAVVTPESLVENNIVKDSGSTIKILGDGEIRKPLTVRAHAFSASAKEKIEKVGGKAEVLC